MNDITRAYVLITLALLSLIASVMVASAQQVSGIAIYEGALRDNFTAISNSNGRLQVDVNSGTITADIDGETVSVTNTVTTDSSGSTMTVTNTPTVDASGSTIAVTNTPTVDSSGSTHAITNDPAVNIDDGTVAVTNTVTVQGTGADAPAAERVTISGHEGNLNAVPVIDYAHEKTHEGMMFEVSQFTEELADDATERFLVSAVTNREMHGEYFVSAEGEAVIRIYQNMNPTNTGAAVTIWNRLSGSTNVSGATIYDTPTFAANGTGDLVHVQYLSGGGGPQSDGGAAGTRHEFILSDNITNYMFEVQNIAGSAKAISSELLFYREDD